MLSITKTVTFDAAHLLTGHPGQCRNLHGHTYRVTVELSAPARTAAIPGDPEDMVLDFKRLKGILRELIVEPCDHAFLHDPASPVEADIAGVLARHGLRVYALPGRTTSENLAQHFFRKLAAYPLPVTAVTVAETPDSTATYREP